MHNIANIFLIILGINSILEIRYTMGPDNRAKSKKIHAKMANDIIIIFIHFSYIFA
jgi:hypothetical protein